MNQTNKPFQRYLLIDGLRGFAITNMVIFHFLYDVYIIYGKNPDWYIQPLIHIWQQAICWTFIFIAGFVWQPGREKNFRRGIFFNMCGAAISLITWQLIPMEAIWFGILNFMGCAVLLMIPLHNIMRKIPPTFGMILSFMTFILAKNIQKGYLGIGDKTLMILPKALYNIKVLTPFGFPFPGFISSDYFLYFLGFFYFLPDIISIRFLKSTIHGKTLHP